MKFLDIGWPQLEIVIPYYDLQFTKIMMVDITMALPIFCLCKTQIINNLTQSWSLAGQTWLPYWHDLKFATLLQMICADYILTGSQDFVVNILALLNPHQVMMRKGLLTVCESFSLMKSIINFHVIAVIEEKIRSQKRSDNFDRILPLAQLPFEYLIQCNELKCKSGQAAPARPVPLI